MKLPLSLVSFQAQLQEFLPLSLSQYTIAVACSGGIDSMVLLDLFLKVGIKPVVLHCNFNLRDEQSDQDAVFVQQYAEHHSLEYHGNSFDTLFYASQEGISTQMAARDLRYAWFDSMGKQYAIDFICTAHHLDDQLETFLINLSRGSGIDGLLGIPKQQRIYLRPLLSFSREQILGYAQLQDVKWREDASNASVKYLRNALRHKVIPELKSILPHFLEAFATSHQHLDTSSKVLTQHITQVKGKVIINRKDGDFFDIDLNILKSYQYHSHYLFYILKPFGFTDWKALQQIFNSVSSVSIYSKDYIVSKHRGILQLRSKLNVNNSCSSTVIDVLNKDDVLSMEPRKLILSKSLSFEFSFNNTIPVVPDLESSEFCIVYSEMLCFPLRLRKRKQGDTFHPQGMKGRRKKLGKFLKDQKVSLLDRNSVWLLVDALDQIIWVVGLRKDERFLIDNSESVVDNNIVNHQNHTYITFRIHNTCKSL